LKNVPNADRNAALKFVEIANSACFSGPTMPFIAAMTSKPRRTLREPITFFPIMNRSRRRRRANHGRFTRFHQFTGDAKGLIREVAAGLDKTSYSCLPRSAIGGRQASKIRVILQKRPDLVNPRESYLAEVFGATQRRLRPGEPVYHPVAASLPDADNPPEPGVRSSPFTIRSIILNCRNCSWNSSAA